MEKLNLENLTEDEIIVIGDALYNYIGRRHKALLAIASKEPKDIVRKNKIRERRDTAQNFYDQIKKHLGSTYSTNI